jgi:hypothetical protein
MLITLEWEKKNDRKFEAKPEEGVRIVTFVVGRDIWAWKIYRDDEMVATGRSSYLSWAQEESEIVYKKEIKR